MPSKFVDAESQYELNKELKKEDVEKLQDWLRMQPHLPPISELQIILFLHSNHYSNEATKKCIDNFFTTRTLWSDFMMGRDPTTDDFRFNIRNCLITPMPKLTPDGYGVFYTRLIDYSPDVYNFNFQGKLFDMVIGLWLHQHGCVKGIRVVLDMEHGTFSHMTKVSLSSLRVGLFYVQEAVPYILKSVHFVNPVSFMDKVLALVKPFMKKELVELLHIETKKSILKTIPASCLPLEAGGVACSAAELHEALIDTLNDNVEFFLDDDKMRADESKRPGKPKNASDFFGVEGTFKKLDID